MIDGNTIDAPGLNGIELTVEDDAYANITNNTITNQAGPLEQGILVKVADFYGAVSDNNVSDSAGWGINVDVANNLNGFIERNTVVNSGGKGIIAVTGSDYLGQFVSNFSDNAAFEAIEVRTVTGIYSGDFSDNTGNNSLTGILTDVGIGAFGVTTGNFASGNGLNFDLSPPGFGGP